MNKQEFTALQHKINAIADDQPIQEDETDETKIKVLQNMRETSYRLKQQIQMLSLLDREMDSSGAGDLQDQLTTMDQAYDALEAVINRAMKIVPQ